MLVKLAARNVLAVAVGLLLIVVFVLAIGTFPKGITARLQLFKINSTRVQNTEDLGNPPAVTTTAAAALPWETASSPWAGLANDLDSLLKQRAEGSAISLSIITAPWKHVVVYYVYSLEIFGNNKHHLIAAFDRDSLQACMDLKLPCWNATYLLQEHNYTGPWESGSDSLFQSNYYKAITWSKVWAAAALLARGYAVHFGDTDTVYLRDVFRTFRAVLAHHNADIVAMEEWGNINTGNWFALSNPRTLAVWSEWSALSANTTAWNDQEALQSRLSQVGLCICKNSTECAACKQQGSAALWLHPPQAFGVVGNETVNCPHRLINQTLSQPGGLCAGYQMYVHAICLTGLGKVQLFRNLSLWFVDDAAQTAEALTAGAHSRQNMQLPCNSTVPD